MLCNMIGNTIQINPNHVLWYETPHEFGTNQTVPVIIHQVQDVQRVLPSHYKAHGETIALEINVEVQRSNGCHRPNIFWTLTTLSCEDLCPTLG